MKFTTGTKASIGLGLTCGAIYIFALIFRATIYPDIYISPTDPYGVADIMELFLFAILIFLMLKNFHSLHFQFPRLKKGMVII